MNKLIFSFLSISLALQTCTAAFAQDGFSGTYQSQQPAQWQPLAPQQGYGQLGMSDWQKPGQTGDSQPQTQVQPGQQPYYGYAQQAQTMAPGAYQGGAGYQQPYAQPYQGPYAPQTGVVTQAQPPQPMQQAQPKKKRDYSGLKKAAVVAAGVGAGVGAFYLINKAINRSYYSPYYYPAYRPYYPPVPYYGGYNPLNALMRL